MKFIRLATISICYMLVASTLCFANADILDIKVIDFQIQDNKEQTITFEAIDDRVDGKTVKKKKRTYIVHIRYNPISLAFSVTEEEHYKALRYLKDILTKEKDFSIWRMSGNGYRPIQDKKGHYRTNALKVVVWGDEKQRVLFVHSDISFYSKN